MPNTAETPRSAYLALTADSEPAWYGTGKGKAHALLTTVTRPGGDHIGSLGLTYTTVHGWSGKTDGMTEQFDNKCSLCEKWLKAHTDAVTATLDAYAEEQSGETVADMILSDPNAVVIGLPALDATPDTDTDATPDSDTAEIKARSASKVAEAPVKVEKCAVKGTHKVEPKPGTDTDGTHGTCPVCQTFAPLTGKGFIGTHTTTGEVQPVTPTLSQKSVKPVDTGSTQGDPSDAAKRRQGEAYVTTGKGKNKTVTPVVPTTTAGQSPIGQRDHGRSDGPAMLPRGTYANGSSPDKTVTTIAKVGKGGYLTQTEYAKLSRSQQRAYWRKIAKRTAR